MSRELPPSSAFADDDGGADPQLAAALEFDGDGQLAAVVHALAQARVLVPVVTRREESEAGRQASAALVSVAAPDGRSALPAFSSMTTLQRWRPDARPVPVAGPRAALAGAEETDGLLVLDAAGPQTVLVPRPAVWALAQGLEWSPPERDEHLGAVVRQALSEVAHIQRVDLAAGPNNATRVVLTITSGLDREAVGTLTAAAGQALAAEPLVAERIDALHFQVRSC